MKYTISQGKTLDLLRSQQDLLKSIAAQQFAQRWVKTALKKKYHIPGCLSFREQLDFMGLDKKRIKICNENFERK